VLVYVQEDPITSFQAVIAIDNTARGPALGGCRFHEYTSLEEAITDAKRLARGMTLKSALANLPLGGGKMVILKPSFAYNRTELFRRAGTFIHTLKGQYITALDSGTDIPDMDAIATQTSFVTCTHQHPHPNPAPFTALGLIEAMKASCYCLWGSSSLKGKTIAIQGLGAVGARLAYLCYQAGGQLRVCDHHPVRVQEAVTMLNATAIEGDFWSEPCDILAPCAMGGGIHDATISSIQAPLIISGANNPLQNEHKHSQMLFQQGITYPPDYGVNAGGIIQVAAQYFHTPDDIVQQHIKRIYQTTERLLTEAKEARCSPVEIAVLSCQGRLGSSLNN
jgi:leucine dehydrogenase